MKRFPYTLFPFRASCWSVCTHWKCSLATVPWHCLPAFALLVKFSRDLYFFNSGCFPTYIGYFSKRKLVSSKFIRSEIMSFIPPSRGYRREATYTRCSQDAQQEKVRNSWAVVNYQGDLVTYQLAHMPDVGPCSFWPICFCVKLLMNFFSSAFHWPQLLLYLLLNWPKFPYFIVFYPFCRGFILCFDASTVPEMEQMSLGSYQQIYQRFYICFICLYRVFEKFAPIFPQVDFTDCHKYLS